MTAEKIRPATSDKHGLFRVWDMQDQEYKDPSQFWIDGDMVLRLLGDTSHDPQTLWIYERYIGFQDSQKKDLYFGDELYTAGFDNNRLSVVTPGFYTVRKYAGNFVIESDNQMILPTQSTASKFTRVGTIHDDMQTLKERAEALK